MKKLLIPVMAVLLMFLGCPSETEVATVTVTPNNASISIGSTQQFTATAYDADNNEITDVDFTWTSSDTTIATVNTSGLATGVSSGTCTITATADDVSGTATLTVTSGPTKHSGAITADETWYPSANPHIIEGDVWVENNATLTIKPGCIVKFNTNTELYAGYSSTAGAIIANGTADSIILFTSNVANPSPGDWYNVGLYNNTMNTSSFSYCTFEYGGGSSGWPGLIYIEDAIPTITGDSLGHSGNWGIYLRGTVYPNPNDLLNNNTFYDCPSGYVHAP